MGQSDKVRSVRIVIEVTAGLIPGRAEPEFTKQFYVFSDEWHATNERGRRKLMENARKDAEAHAAKLMDPRRLNWVRTDWVYL